VPQITFLRHDLIDQSIPQRGDVIRAANLLNPECFDKTTLLKMIDGLARAVVEGGLVVICGTTDTGVNNATVFRRTASGCEVVDRLGAGSEVEALLAGWAPDLQKHQRCNHTPQRTEASSLLFDHKSPPEDGGIGSGSLE
jgi:hypothetical protein